MRGASASGCIRSVCALAVVAVFASPAAAIEFWEGRFSIHGYYEQQIRSIVRDYSFRNDWDLTQWYHILNLEMEAEIAPDGFGPFDLISAFGRVEVRYDCVWTRACGIFSSADAYGDRAHRLPKQLLEGRRSGYTMQYFTGNTRKFRTLPYNRMGDDFRDWPDPARTPITFPNLPGPEALSASKGVDGVLGTWDDPFPFYTGGSSLPGFESGFMNPDDCKFGVQATKGNYDGISTRNLPWTPKCRIEPIGPMAGRPNPLSSGDFNPILLATGNPYGFGALPLRPAPQRNWEDPTGRREEAQGLWMPNERLAQMIRDGEFDSFDQNFRQAELEWNRGASQQDEKELKELYFDLELFDSRLWLRIGKQNIVWGKTELFRTTDQFNPQDLALASLPSLEESRIALWAVRAVWSFYDVGPLEDVRFELGMNYDQFEPMDLGRCGEPYAPLPVCDKTYGLLAHGFVADAIAGEIRTPSPWNSWKGIEVGGRLEWRLGRFSFAVTDFYGFDDGPYVDPIFSYSRNVDPETGRPRVGMSTGSCVTGLEPDCLTEANALAHHSVNQTNFAFICATSIGFNDLDRQACGQTVYSSQKAVVIDEPDPLLPRVMIAVTNGLSGQNNPLTGGAAVLEAVAQFNPSTIAQLNDFDAANPQAEIQRFTSQTYGAGTPTVFVPLSADPNDGLPLQPADIPPDLLGPPITFWSFTGVDRYLTDEQEALLGCGAFYGTRCDLDGIDLMNMEGSAQIMSWPLFEGTFTGRSYDPDDVWLTTDASRIQPGTVGFEGGPVCTRFEDGELHVLPGCRKGRYPGDPEADPDYDPNVDGTTTGPNSTGVLYPAGRRHPFTGQPWANEMAIVSWNTMIVLVALSFPPDDPADEGLGLTYFDPDQPFRPDGCSFAAPAYCNNVSAYNAISGVRRNSLRAGGNGRFGRRDFIWHGGGDLVLRYEKRNVLGFSMDFAEDFTKSNWGLEFTWIEGLPFGDQDSFDATSKADSYNLTLSVDRPTFINFLNQNRCLFFNSQWFFQYVDGYTNGFTSSGPWNMLATFTVTTGYFQDRLLPGVTFVYDFRSNSGAVLPEVTYRFTENFSATFGLAGFWGRYEPRKASLYENALDDRVGRGAYTTYVENGLSAVRERDEAYLTIRYTF